jgi:hypothetical protein
MPETQSEEAARELAAKLHEFRETLPDSQKELLGALLGAAAGAEVQGFDLGLSLLLDKLKVPQTTTPPPSPPPTGGVSMNYTKIEY